MVIRLGFGARRLVEDKNVPKYINTPESLLYHKGRTLYGINLAKDSILKNDSCLVVEGYLDMIMPFQYGISNIVASLGTALTAEQIRMMKRYTKNIVLVFDSDTAGKASSLRAIDSMIEHDLTIKAVSLPPGFDPDSFVKAKGKEGFLQCVQEAQDFFNLQIVEISCSLIGIELKKILDECPCCFEGFCLLVLHILVSIIFVLRNKIRGTPIFLFLQG